MITVQNLKEVLLSLGFTITGNDVYSKEYAHFDHFELSVDFEGGKIVYPAPIKLGDTTTSNFEHPENFVVLECVTRLLDKGYRPEHIGLEKRWQLGRGSSGGKADICVTDEKGDMLFIVECKTAGKEYRDELKKMNEYGGQLFSYLQQERSTRWLVLYASDFKEDVEYDLTIIKCIDDVNILKMAIKDKSVLTYEKARTVEDLYAVWDETYSKATHNDIIFDEDSIAYNIGERQLRKKDLKDFTPEDKIVNRFEEILRHNNVSDKENAFNRLIALFICKLVDEIKKADNEIVDFQYKVGTDTYESLQDRLQRLHKVGMQEFMQEEINYIDDGYADRVFGQLSQSKRKKAIEDLRNTLRILKYYTNNDFTFKDVHNEELFYQNGKVLVEVVQLFEKYRIVYAAKHQFLGDLFEQLLNKGFKQNEGQFFTPMPITRFIWDSLPLDKVLHGEGEFRLPKVIDYACGAGHFLTEAVEAINAYFHQNGADNQIADNAWVEKNIFGIEKDYRLARVAKVSLYMNGAGKGQIVFGDGLEQYPEKGITNGTFDILVANPPYSVDAFKAHLKLKNNQLEILPLVSSNGSEIETVFVERIAQLLKPKGVAAVLLPSSILSNDSETYIAAREQILKHFNLRAVVQLGGKTFGATNTNTVILFLEKFNEPPKRNEQVSDSVDAIIANEVNEEWEDKEILDAYLERISVTEEQYTNFRKKSLSLDELEQITYFSDYVTQFRASTRFRALQNSNTFRRLSEADQQERIQELFYQQQFEAEREKIYYFALVYKQNTLIISSPSNNDEQKRFLGYDWSNRRGNEGIQINTPGGMLYNDQNRNADNTLAAAVREVYNENQPNIPDREQYYIFARLRDMIDFSRPTFNKAIKTTIDKQVVIKSRYPMIRFEDIISQLETGSRPSGGVGQNTEGALSLGGEHIDNSNGHLNLSTPKYVPLEYYNSANRGKIEKNDILLCKDGALTGKVAIVRDELDGKVAMINEHVFIIRCENIITQKYLFEFLYSSIGQSLLKSNITGSAQGGLNSSNLKNIKLPFPPSEVQQKIVAECAKVDKEYNTSRIAIEENRHMIQQAFDNLQAVGVGRRLRLNQICTDIFAGGDKPQEFSTTKTEDLNIPVYANGVENDGLVGYTNHYRVNQDAVTISARGTLGFACVRKEPFFPIVRLIVALPNQEVIKVEYLKYAVSAIDFVNTGGSIPQLTVPNVEMEEIVVPSLEEQERIIAQVEQYEAAIRQAQAIMDACAARKKAILDKYLK